MSRIIFCLIFSILSMTSAFTLIKSFSSTGIIKTVKLSSTQVDSTVLLDSKKYIESAPVSVIIGSATRPSFFQTKPFKQNVTWTEVFTQLSEKCSWEYLNNRHMDHLANVKMNLVNLDENHEMIPKSQVYLLIGLTNDQKSLIEHKLDYASVISVFDSEDEISSLERYGEYRPYNPNKNEDFEVFVDNLLKNERKRHREAYSLSHELWNRRSGDDIVFMIYVLIDLFTNIPIKSVQSVTSSEQTGLSEITCMCQNCAKEMIDCFLDESCRKALDCLNSCRGNDQVCSYRCITSHESEKFERFALCILQRNNCMKNSATIPSYPDPAPLAMFRGEPLTHDVAEGIFIGHLQPHPESSTTHIHSLLDPSNSFASSTPTTSSTMTATSTATTTTASVTSKPAVKYEEWSWKVVCGQNPAYDYFGCQHQIFYRDLEKPNVVWYDPVFKVTTLYGEDVWRRRHYRVRRAKQPGQFYFSVIDNGVASNEFWRILDCADDLSWATFYYSGAASAAGTNYRGALVVTPDGKWPVMTEDTTSRISASLDRAGIKMWELFEVSNTDCGCNCKAGPPPLALNMTQATISANSHKDIARPRSTTI